jgi:DNA-binding transcriptional LysR family regulator
METVNFNRLAYFAAVVDAGSFTKAAERLGITKTVVSQQVARLEGELRTTLLSRTTRRVEPTETGRIFYARCVMILREVEDAFGEIAQSNAEPNGVLRVAAPIDYGTYTIAPLTVAFTRRYPSCTVDLVLSDTKIDIIANQIDVSIRVGWLADSTLQARRIGGFRQLLVAAPEVACSINSDNPDDLAAAPFIANSALREPLLWQFNEGDFNRRTVRMRPAMTMNTTPAAMSATLAGGGVSVLPDFLAAEHIETGRLIHLLPSWNLPSGGIHTIYPAARFRPPKVSAFVSMLVDANKDAPRQTMLRRASP